MYLPDLNDAKTVNPIPFDNIEEILKECMSIDDEARKLFEATGLHVDDIKLDFETPHINLKPHSWRGLKTRGQRHAPPVGASLWAVKCPSDMIDRIGGWSTSGVGQVMANGIG